MSDFETVSYEIDEQVAIITMNRPKARNALTRQMRLELTQAIQQASDDVDVRVVMITGAGKGFCAGADLVEMDPDADRDGFITEQLRNEYHPIIESIISSKKPFIAAVNGAAAGIGGAIAMACDLVVMADDAFLYSAFGAIALIPDGGTHWILSKYIGNKKAFEMIAESKRLTAEECETLGMTNRVVAADVLIDESLSWAKSLTKQAPLTLQYSKQILREASTMTLAQTMDLEAQLQNHNFRSEDFKEGASAFFEKRAPRFTGK